MGDKRCAKGQTLNYINGYRREEALREVRDPTEATTAGALCATSSPSKTNISCKDSPVKLPKWVEMDRKVSAALERVMTRELVCETCQAP
jgi:hypothetical protein